LPHSISSLQLLQYPSAYNTCASYASYYTYIYCGFCSYYACIAAAAPALAVFTSQAATATVTPLSPLRLLISLSLLLPLTSYASHWLLRLLQLQLLLLSLSPLLSQLWLLLLLLLLSTHSPIGCLNYRYRKNNSKLTNFPPPHLAQSSLLSRIPLAAAISLHKSKNTFPSPLRQPSPSQPSHKTPLRTSRHHCLHASCCLPAHPASLPLVRCALGHCRTG
jgi:hypothetical protein